MNSQTILISVAATFIVLPNMALAAIDDQGMAYVSASEGLSGRIQMRWEDTNAENVDGSVKLDTLRLYLSGDLDIGGGMKSTYYTEIRNNEAGDGLILHAYDIGLTGAFGTLSMGRLDGVTERMVPGGSLDAVAGTNAESPASHPHDNGLRYESPEISGFTFGLSSKVDGNNQINVGGHMPTSILAGIYGRAEYASNGAFDRVNAAISYQHPIGLQLGYGIEKLDGFGPNLGWSAGVRRHIDHDKDGWRAGARFSQQDWTVSYEHRKYAAFNGNGINGSGTEDNDNEDYLTVNHRVRTDSGAITGEDRTAYYYFDAHDTSYKVDRLGVQYKLDRLTASVNYSKEVLTPVFFSEDPPFPDFPVDEGFKPTRTILGADLAYSLGTRSRIAIGLVNTKANQIRWVQKFRKDITPNPYVTAEAQTTETNKFILDYQINF